MKEFTPEYIARLKICLHLLPEPGPEVFGDCIEEIESLQSRLSTVEAELTAANELLALYVIDKKHKPTKDDIEWAKSVISETDKKENHEQTS